MLKIRSLTCILLSACLAGMDIPHASGRENTQIKPVVSYYNGTELLVEYDFAFKDNSRITDDKGNEWVLSVKKDKVKGQPDATDYTLAWTLAKGSTGEVAVGVRFPVTEWRPDNFVFVPAAVYDGNRFEVKDMPYPPYWYDKSEWRLDMPTTVTNVPTLGKGQESGLIELTTGSASTPLMAYHSPSENRAWMVQTTQGSRFGEHGMIIEEDNTRSEAVFSITAPAMRKQRATGGGFAPSGDTAPDWQEGDGAVIRFRIYEFSAPTLQDMMRRFSEVRKDLNPDEKQEVLPFSEAWVLLENLFRNERWDGNIDMFCLSKPGTGTSWNFIWQLGWCGGGQSTLPLMMQGSEDTRKKAIANMEVIFSKSQAPSGLFNAYGNGVEFKSFGYFKPFEHNETFIRSQGDWLYMAQRQFEWMESHGYAVPSHWKSGLKKQADAFVRLWDKYGQFGQFADVETGDICIGGSTAGAIVPGGLALASRTYGDDRYLKAAEEAGRKYHRDYVLKGYTTGGPGEILSTPDSESAFALFEAYMSLYEVTGGQEWLGYASDLLPVCASWTVSYDFEFPEESVMGKIDARSCGAFWASVANKHAAPGICTWSGDCLLKYYRATGDERAAGLITDIAHGVPQYISREDRPIGGMPPGGICERVNLSDWEGKGQVGGNIFSSCSWCEAAALLTVTQLPGVYVQPDKGFYTVFDNIKAEKIKPGKGNKMALRLMNPTKFPATVKVFSETSEQARTTPFSMENGNVRTVYLEPDGGTGEIYF